MYDSTVKSVEKNILLSVEWQVSHST